MLENISYLTCAELASIVGRSERTIQRYVRQKKIMSVTTLDGIRIPESEARHFARELTGGQWADSWRQEPTMPDRLADRDRHLPTDGVKQRHEATVGDDKGRHLTTGGDSNVGSVATGGDNHRQQITMIPLEVHTEALKGIQEALRLVEERNQVAEQMRQRAEQAERQKLAIEVELQKYRLALSEQAESLAEERARTMTAQAQLEKLKCDAPKLSFGQKVKAWLFGNTLA